MAIDAALGRLGIREGVCTSSTRPTNPFEGQLIYETDTNRTLVYDNSAWLVVADNQVLSIDPANGRVGVNDASPSYALDVTGDINASGDLRIGGTAYTNRLGSGAAVEVPGTFAGGDVLQAAEMNALPGGVVGVDVRTTSQSLTTSDATTHSVTFTAVSGRRYVALFSGLFEGISLAGVIVRADIDVNGARTFAARLESAAASDVESMTAMAVFTASGSTTVDVVCNVTTGTAQLTAAASITSPLIVFDIGES